MADRYDPRIINKDQVNREDVKRFRKNFLIVVLVIIGIALLSLIK